MIPGAGVTLGRLLAEARAVLAELPDAALDARLLVEELTGTSRSDAISRPDQPIDATRVERVRAALARRKAGEPVHRILGFRDFHGHRLHLSSETLEPRPDTEALVDAASGHVRRIAAINGSCRLLDLGTGTGAIAIALLAAEPAALGVGADCSRGALETARLNANLCGVGERFKALRSDWFSAVEGRFDIIVSNPPYIPSAEIETLSVEVREHDPHTALDGGTDGLDAYRRIAAGAREHLNPAGIIAVEIGLGQGPDVVELFRINGYRLLESANDLGGRQRALVFSDAI